MSVTQDKSEIIEVINLYGVALDTAGQHEQARKLWEESLRAAPYDPSLLFALAGAERDAGNKEQARDYAQRLVAVAPRSREAHELLQSLGGDSLPAFH